MKNKKLFILFLSAILLCFCFSSCGSKDKAKVISEQVGVPETQYITNKHLRSTVVNYMYKMANIEWTSRETIDNSHMSPSLIYEKGQTYYGMPYNWDSIVSFDKFSDAIKNGKSVLTMGNTCSTSILEAWQSVSNKVQYYYTADMMPGRSKGTVAIGDIPWDDYDGENTINSVLKATDQNTVYEAYALTHPGDAFMRHPNHAMMVTGKTNVVRTSDGTIDPTNSKVILTHQNSPMNHTRNLPSSWKVDFTMTFSKLYSEGYLPVTIPELLENKTEKPYFILSKHIDPASLNTTGNLYAHIKSNYKIDTLKAELYKNKESGKLVKSVTVHPNGDSAAINSTVKQFEINTLPSGKYYFKITASNTLATQKVLEIKIERK